MAAFSVAVCGAVKMCGIGPGDEVVTSTITDAGSILGVVYKGGIPGIRPHAVPAGGYATYWYYLVGIDPTVLGVEAAAFGRAMNAEGITGSGQFYMEPVHLAYSYLGRRTAFHHSTYPFSLARKEVSYRRGTCPNAEAMRSRVFYVPLNEWLTNREIDDTVAAVRKVAAHFSGKAR